MTDKAKIEYSETGVKEILKPRSGQVLIKVECAPINPSDLYYMQGNYNGQYKYPLIPGSEGSGTVLESGGGLMAWSLKGKRVGFTRMMEKGGQFSKDGSYGEYIVTNAYQCVSLDDKVSFEQGSCSFVNPVTAIGLLDRCQTYKAKCVIQTGAASQLGRMMIRLFKENRIPCINIVRRDEQVKMLKEEYGCEHVLNSESENFE